MPLFMDRHELAGATPEELAQAHLCDLNVQSKYGVRFVTYWYHRGAANGFCLLEAPSMDAAQAAHREAHGNLACQMIEVDWRSVEGFLGRPREPVPGEVWEAVARRTIVKTVLDAPSPSTPAAARLIRASLRERGALGLRSDGDLIGCFPSATAALEYSLAMQQSFVPLASLHERTPVRARIGIGIGEPVAAGFGLFGEACLVAEHLCAVAEPGEVLVPADLRDVLGQGGFLFEEREEISIPGLDRPLRYDALKGRDPVASRRRLAPPVEGVPDGLSAREIEVLRLIAIGKTNLEIADLLFISHSTVASHVRSIFNKANVGNRAEATSYAYRHRLVRIDEGVGLPAQR